MTTKAEYQKQIEDLREKSEASILRLQKIDKEEDKIYKQMEQNTASLRQQIVEEEKPFRAKLTELKKESEQCREFDSHITSFKIRDLQDKITLHGIKEMSQESFAPFLRLKTMHPHKANFKKELDNGIKIFKAEQYDYNSGYQLWVAFYGMKVVAFSVRRKAEHRGDSTMPYTFMHTTEKELTQKKPSGYCAKWHQQPCKECKLCDSFANYTDLENVLKGVKDPSKLERLNFTNEQVQRWG